MTNFKERARKLCNNLYHDKDKDRFGECNFCRGFSQAIQQTHEEGRKQGYDEAVRECERKLRETPTMTLCEECPACTERVAEALQSLLTEE